MLEDIEKLLETVRNCSWNQTKSNESDMIGKRESTLC
jgi:hypothetical protein